MNLNPRPRATSASSAIFVWRRAAHAAIAAAIIRRARVGGREIVEFVARYGPLGSAAILFSAAELEKAYYALLLEGAEEARVEAMGSRDSVSGALGRVILYAILIAVVMGILQWVFTQGVDGLVRATGLKGLLVLKDYAVYVYIIVLLVLGWMAVSAIASLFYAMLAPRYGVSTAAAVRSMVRILGLGGLLAGIAGGVAGGAAGVALGGFIGLVVGFATQQVLGQAVAGMFLLLARPFRIGDVVDVAGESEVTVKDVSTMFTVVERKDGLEVLIPSGAIVGQKIVIRKRAPAK